MVERLARPCVVFVLFALGCPAERGAAPAVAVPLPWSERCGACKVAPLCGSEGCVQVATRCSASSDCGPYTCADGVCTADVPGHCRSDADCASHRRCAAIGLCVHRWSDDGALLPSCGVNADCGAGGRCHDGRCAACSARDPCDGALICTLGRCSEPASCAGDADCFAGNRCDDGRCRWAEDCELDESNDGPDGAVELPLGYWSGHTICGAWDEDWFRIVQPAGQGRRIIVRTDPAVNTVFASIGGSAVGGSTLRSPGLTVLELPATDRRAELLVDVAGTDRTGPYAIEVTGSADRCAGDAFDLYGDDDPAVAPVVAGSYSAVRRACPGDVDIIRTAIERSDRLDITARFGKLADIARQPGLQAADLDLWLADGAGKILGSAASTSTTIERLRSEPAVDPELWTIGVQVSSAPPSGEPYGVRVSRELGRRRTACEAAAAPGALPLVLDADLADVGCGLWGPDHRPDAVVSVRPPRLGALLRFTAIADSGPSPTVRLSHDCMADAPAAACVAGSRARTWTALQWTADRLAPVYVWVSGRQGQRVQVEVSFDQADNFTCAGKRAQDVSGGGRWQGSTAGSTDTASPACRGAPISTGPDRFYLLQLDAGDRAVAELSGLKGGLLWASTDCATAAISCVDAATVGPFAQPARLVLGGPAANNYLLVVDGAEPSVAGAYVLDVRVNPGCIVDEDCAGSRCVDWQCR